MPIAIAGLLAGQTTAPVTVDAIVCDARGTPLAGVEFGDVWGHAAGRWSPGFVCPDPGRTLRLTSDDQGRIRGTWTLSPFAHPLLGLSADRRLAVFVFPECDATTHDLHVRGRVVMQPAVRLRAAARTTAATADALVIVLGFPHPLHAGLLSHLLCSCDARTFELPLPPQSYEVAVRLGRGVAAARTAVLEAGRDALDLGPISVPAAAFDLVGEVLPDWHVDRAENLDLAKARLGDFRGKPLLVHFDEFDGRWYPRGEGRQALARLAQHPRRAEFGVVLFDTSIPRRWPPRDPPAEPVVERMFPLVADSTHATAELYGSHWATILLDRDGRLLVCGGLDQVVAALERHLALDAATAR